jgi:CTP:molybdopterin cytidylyltransferase MocA
MPEAETGAEPAFRFGAVIMAAGGSSRMGGVKQLLVLEGKPLIARSVDAVLGSAARPVVVVLGANAEGVREPIARHSVLVAFNADWPSGLASSVRVGLAALLAADPGLDAVLLAPCDQPALSPKIISRLAAVHRESGRIAAARFGGRNGAPAVFGRRHFAALQALEGDEGARRLLNGRPQDVAALDLPELEVDLDTPADYRSWVGQHY